MLTRNFYNIGFTPAYVYMYSTSSARCSFIPLADADKKNARTILNTDGKRIISPDCTVTEANEDNSSKMPSYGRCKDFGGESYAFYPFMLAATQSTKNGYGEVTASGLRTANDTIIPKLNTDQFKTGYTERILITGYRCNAFIILGSGNTNPTIDDYKLENCNLDYSVSEYKQSYNSFTQIANASVTIVPNVDGGTVSEIGVYTMCTESMADTNPTQASIITSDVSDYTNCCCMIARSVLANPVTLEANKPYTFTYTIDYGKMSDRVS